MEGHTIAIRRAPTREGPWWDCWGSCLRYGDLTSREMGYPAERTDGGPP